MIKLILSLGAWSVIVSNFFAGTTHLSLLLRWKLYTWLIFTGRIRKYWTTWSTRWHGHRQMWTSDVFVSVRTVLANLITQVPQPLCWQWFWMKHSGKFRGIWRPWSFQEVDWLSEVSQCSFMVTIPGHEELKEKWWIFFIPVSFLNLVAKKSVQLYTRTIVVPPLVAMSWEKLHMAD